MSLQLLRSTVRRMDVRNWRRATGPWPILVALFVAINVVLLFDFMPAQLHVAVGQVARWDVVAPRRIINRYKTEQLRQQAADTVQRESEAVAANYKIDTSASYKAEESVAAVFRVWRGEPLTGADNTTNKQLSGANAIHAYILDELGLDIPLTAVRAALKLPAAKLAALEAVARKYVGDAMRAESINQNQVELVRSSVAEQVLNSTRPADERTVLAGVVQVAITTNLILDREKIDKMIEQAKRQVQTVYVEQGQIIVREKDLIQSEHYEIMKDLGLLGRQANYAAILGVVLLVTLLLAAYSFYIVHFHMPMIQQPRLLVLLASTLLVNVALAKGASLVAWEGIGYLVPTALTGMLIAILLDSRLAIMSVLFVAVIVGIVMGQDTKYVMFTLAGGLSGVFSVSRISQRIDLTRAGLIVGLINFLALFALGLFRAEAFMLKFAVLGVFNGLGSAVLAIGLLPYLETIFGITSPIRLLELSNSNSPLLRRLLMEVPGSYHHSLIVGNLAEAAASAIGGNPLLARVGAQYHDIGKTKRPNFFIENQYVGENPHDSLSPSLSTLIITAHVRDGVEMARTQKMPAEVVDIIAQHHGKDLVRYFHHKALENAKGQLVDPDDFRYPGPRPQTKEAATVMLADSVEAAVRSLERPTPGIIEGLVRRIIRERLNDGQLDESDLTLKDLDRIADAFVKVLSGIFHRRISYPQANPSDLLHLDKEGVD